MRGINAPASSSIRVLLAAAVAATLLCALAACGASRRAEVVAEVDHVPITRAELAVWMSTLAITDFNIHAEKDGGAGLVSEPIDLGRCVAAAKGIASRATATTPMPAQSDFETKCSQLFRGVQRQALSYLITYRWRLNEAKRHGIVVSDHEVEERLRAQEAEHAEEPGGFSVYLEHQGKSLEQARSELKLETVINRYSARLAPVHSAQGLERLLKVIAKAEPANRAATKCMNGYVVVPECSGFVEQKEQLPSPAVLVERIAARQ